jgi:hypothetical protein
MNFDSPNSVVMECQQMLISQQANMRNRTLIQKLFNGEAPSSDEERREQNLKTNVNFLEATRIASNATSQLNSAFFKGDRYFTVSLDKGPVEKRSRYATSITKAINRELKRSRAYRSAREAAHAQVVLHGVGPLVWKNKRCPVPSCFGIEDVVVPSGTITSMENLDRFGIYQELSWTELYRLTSGPAVDAGWNMPYVKALLVTMYAEGVVPVFQGNRWLFPEKVYEDIKEGSAWSGSSSLPKVGVWNFFYREDDSDKWCRKMALDFGTINNEKIKPETPINRYQQFIYESDTYADEWENIIHWYIGNCSNIAPYRYYSIRSIGYLLYGVCMLQNKMRCRMSDHVFQSLLTLFRNVSDDNREKLGMIDLQNFGVMPDGLSMVVANERHTVDWNLVNFALGQNRQLMAESAMGFLPDTMSEGANKEMTASEWIGRMNISIALTSAVHTQLAEQSKTEYREICRRFCIKGNSDPIAKRFREYIEKDGVPLDMLDIDAWDIIPEQVIGGGNKAAEFMTTQAMVQELLPYTDPNGQRLILRKRALALTDNSDEALLLFPDAPQPPSNDVQYAQSAYAVLMLGVPFAKKEGVNHIAYAAMLMQMMQITLQQVAAATEQPQGIAIAADKIMGLFNVAQHVQEEIDIIAKVDNQVEKAKIMFKALTQMMAQLNNIAKQLMAAGEAQSQHGGIDPETQAKIQEKILLAQNQIQIDTAKAQQKQEQKEIAFTNENLRRNAMTQADIQRKMALTQTEIAAKDLTTAAEIERPTPQPAGK